MSNASTVIGINSPYAGVYTNTNPREQYRHVLPGSNQQSMGDRMVPLSHKGMDTLAYKSFEASHDTYLSVTGMNFMLLAAVVTIFTHLAMVISNQKEFKSSTIADIIKGPLLMVVIAGLTGVGLLFGHFGISDDLYYVLYIPFGLMVLGVGIWSILSDAKVNKFTLEGMGDIMSFAPDALIWVGIAALIVVSTIVQWMSGGMRLDAMRCTSGSTILFVVFTALFAYGLSKIFALLIRTLDANGIGNNAGGRNSPEFATMYIIGSLSMVIIIVSSIKFLDTSINLFGGHINSIFAPPAGIGAAKSILETQRSYKFAIYTVVFLCAALMWRRRNGLVIANKDNKTTTDVTNEWLSLGLILVFVPMFALISELIKNWIKVYSPFYDLLRALILSVVVVYVGTGYVPWNYPILSVSGAIMVMVMLGYVNAKDKWDKPAVALICAGMFVMGKLLFRAGETWYRTKGYNEDNTEEDKTEISTPGKVWLWVMNIIFPAIILVLLSSVRDTIIRPYQRNPSQFEGSYGTHMFKMYLAFTIFYSLTLTFVDTNGSIPLKDSTGYDLVPENEAASLAIDGLILMACIMSTMAVWNVIVPIEILDANKNIEFNYKDKNLMKLSALSFIGNILMGMGCTYLYINVRHDRAMSSFARESQQKTEQIYINTLKDAAW